MLAAERQQINYQDNKARSASAPSLDLINWQGCCWTNCLESRQATNEDTIFFKKRQYN